jgi:hypothetical protein
MTAAYLFACLVQTLDPARYRSGFQLLEFTATFQPPFGLSNSDGFR